MRAWERRLSPLSRLAPEVPPPPELWQRIAESIGPAPEIVTLKPARSATRFWQASTAAALALAAGLAAFVILRGPAPPVVAVLAPTGSPVLLALEGPGSALTVRPAGPLATVPNNRDLELWALPEGATRPRPLGVLPAAGLRLEAGLPAGTQILVSLEPKGGSPSGLPTGPVLYAGRLQQYVE